MISFKKNILIGISLIFIGLPFSFHLEASNFSWKELKGDHFLIYVSSENEKSGREALNEAEAYYRQIAHDLGYERRSDFWTWGNRVKIYIYPDQKTYLETTGEPEWSAGVADYQNKEIKSYFGSVNFIDSVLPHEITHLIFNESIKFKTKTPRWLTEGIAQLEEKNNKKNITLKAKMLYETDSLISINDILKIHIDKINKHKNIVFFKGARARDNTINLLLLTPEILINSYYIESASFIDYLIETGGGLRFKEFCELLASAKKFEEALITVYFGFFDSTLELEDKWREHLAKFPSDKETAPNK